jgi:hypothetical protein
MRDRPQIVRSSFRGLVKSVRNLAQVIGKQVPVAVQRERRRLVAEQRLEHLHIGPGSDGQTRTGVAQLMRCQEVGRVTIGAGAVNGVNERETRRRSGSRSKEGWTGD